MRKYGTLLGAVACGLLIAFACSDHDTRPGSDSAAGTAGQGGTTAAQGGTAGRSQGGDGDDSEMHARSGAAGSEAGEAGATFLSGGAGNEGGGGANTSAGGTSGEGGAKPGGAPGEAGATGAAGAPPSRATPEQRALCESLCAKEPLTNGFAGAPTAPCPNNESCADGICGIADIFPMPTEVCMAAFTALLACWNSIPDQEYECGSEGLLLTDECQNENTTMLAVCV